MRWLLSKRHWGVDLGAPTVRLLDGRLLPNNRTAVRNCGIEELVSRYPWASNTADLQIFLEGFDLGEQFSRGSLSIADTKPFVGEPSINSIVQKAKLYDSTSN
jgi:hypothetical protein